MIFSFGVVSPGLGQDAEAMLAAGCGGGVAEAGEHLQGLPVAAFRLDVIPPGLGDLADLMDPRRAQRRVPWKPGQDRKSTRLNSSHVEISYAVFCLKKKKNDGDFL